MIHVKSESEINLMREPCKIVHDTLEFVGSKIKAGMSTKEVDELVERYIRSAGAYPSCLGYGGFPASVCVSVNVMVVHGIPDDETFAPTRTVFTAMRRGRFASAKSHRRSNSSSRSRRNVSSRASRG